MKIIIGVAAIVVVVLLGVVGYNAYSKITPPSPPPAPPAPTPTPTPKPSPQPSPAPPATQTPPSNIEQKVSDLAQAIQDVAKTGTPKKVTLSFTEAEINAQITAMLPQVKLPPEIPVELKSVRVDLLTNNQLAADIGASLMGFSTTIKLKGRVSVVGGQPKLDITDANFGLIPVPQTMKDQLVAMISQNFAQMLFQIPQSAAGGSGVTIEYTDMTIQQDTLTATVLVKPKA